MIAADKIAHFKAGMIAAAFGAAMGFVMALLNWDAADAVLCSGIGAAVAAITAGITKELADHADNVLSPGMHGVEIMDAVATALGSWPVLAIIWAIDVAVHQWLH